MKWLQRGLLGGLLTCGCSTDAPTESDPASSEDAATGQATTAPGQSTTMSNASTTAGITSNDTGTGSATTGAQATSEGVGATNGTGAGGTGGANGTQTVSTVGGAGGASTGGMSTDGSQAPSGTPVEEERAAMPIPRGEHGVAALNGEVYVLGGFTPTVTASVQVYTPETDSWRDAADFPVVFHHPNVAAVNGLLYVLGFHAGMGQRVADGSAFAYDPEADAWEERASLPPGSERGASCVTTYEDKIYVFGGTNDVAMAEASAYDPAADRWEVLPLLPALRHHCIAAVVNGKIYIVSGREVVIEEVQAESFVFDPVALTYQEVAPILTPRGGAAGGVLGGRIYVFGGEGNVDDPNGIFHQAEEYDPATNLWSALPDLAVPRHGFGAAVIGDRMYMPGGSTRQGIQAQTVHSVFFFQAP